MLIDTKINFKTYKNNKFLKFKINEITKLL
jgi:hypothetical protein